MNRKSSKVLRGAGTLLLGAALLLPGLPTTASAEEAAFPNTIDVKKIAGYSTGLTEKDGGVAEIVKYNPENQKFYVINGKNQTIDVVSLAGLKTGTEGQQLKKEKSIDIGESVNDDSFTYGDLTSIDVNTEKNVIVAAVQDKDYAANGKIVVLDYDGNLKKSFDVGVQPDMVKMSADGAYILSADEGEPRAGLGDGIVDPDGSVSIVNTETGKVNIVKFTDASVIEDGVHIRYGGKENAVKDFEPEYIALSPDHSKAYVTLQENNAIATIDVASGTVQSVKSLGFKDHSLPENALDANREDKEAHFEQLPIRGVYMPDGIAYFEAGGEGYLVTGNEGDATEWGDEDDGNEFVNVADFEDWKDQITDFNPTLFKGLNEKEARDAFNRMKDNEDYDKLEVLTDRGNDAIYTLGGRSFSVWKADTMEQVYDSGSDFEKITAERLPDYFNWSNDGAETDKRSAKKGPEPEDVKVGMIGDDVYAFVGLERISGVMSYNISNPTDAGFANYVNTRDFEAELESTADDEDHWVPAGDVAPEGLEFVPAEVSPTGRPLMIVGNEVSGTVAVNEYQVAPYIHVESLTLDKTSASLEVGKTLQLKATVSPENATDKAVTWTSSDEKVATVSSEGLVTAVAPGKATIQATTEDGALTATAEFTVTKPDKGEGKPDPDNGKPDQGTPGPGQNQSDNNKDTTGEKTTDGNTENDKASADGSELPDTATDQYTIALLGLVLAGGGAMLYLVYRKQRTRQH